MFFFHSRAKMTLRACLTRFQMKYINLNDLCGCNVKSIFNLNDVKIFKKLN